MPPASVLPTLPLFTPTTQAAGLGALAAVASGDQAPDSLQLPSTRPTQSLLGAGPFNPAASLPPRIVKKILDLEFVEMSEVSADADPAPIPGRPPPSRPPITTLSQWLERFSLMAATLPGKSARAVCLSGNTRPGREKL